MVKSIICILAAPFEKVGDGKIYLQARGAKYRTFSVRYPEGKTW